MKMKALLVALVTGIFLSLASIPGWAGITIKSDFTGTLVITTPEGEIQLIEAGEKIPQIPSGSVVEVFDGAFTITTGPEDLVHVSCLEHDATVEGGASLTLVCMESDGSAKVLEGTVILIDTLGKEIILGKGAEYLIQLTESPEEALPTAAGEETGFPYDGDMPDVDSRDIETSPAV